jgi:hypothetical protein
MRNAAGELDHFEAALDVALGVGEGLAVLGGQQPREIVIFASAISSRNLNMTRARRCGLVAAQAGKRRLGIGDRLLDLGTFPPARPWPAPRRYWD